MFMVDSLSPIPVYEQIIKQAELFMINDVLPADAPMPSVRSVASETASNPNTVQKAYAQMLGRGLLYAVPGKGSFVSKDAKSRLHQKFQEDLTTIEDMSEIFANVGIDKQLVIEAVERGYQKKKKG